ncbi:MAG: hypothetical protein CVU11_15285 [Bacteroidetes bacterium HGW-Bacteroidetes-6]|jgi:YD repeat-containing protein|nr:MAG: hypothetical protein CVU11_15285 [Bacteroidetes bacterium HGW-Bacteroidetes-6]
MKSQIIILAIIFIGISVCAQNNNDYQYDNLSRLTRVSYPNGTVYQYSYDQLGNRVLKVIQTSSASQPELSVMSPVLDANTIAAGAQLGSSCNIANTGNGNASSFFVKYYLSTDQTYQPGIDTEIGSYYCASLNSGINIQVSSNLFIPLGTAAGVYYVLFFADGTEALSEINELNNIEPVQLNVISCTAMQIDLSITDATCGMNNGVVSSVVSGGTAPYTYYWSNGGTNSSIANLSGENYLLTVTDVNGCINNANATVNIIGPPVIDLVSTDATCGNSDGSVTANVTDGMAPYLYIWNTGATTSTVNNLPAGNYSVTVSDAFNCIITDNISVSTPANIQVTLHSTNPTCGYTDGAIHASVSGGTAPFNYAWSSGQSTQSISNLDQGIYTITVTDSLNCSFTTNTTLIHVNNLTINTSATNTTCGINNGTTWAGVSNGTAPYSFLWDNGQSTQLASNLAAGTYNVTVTDANGCSTISYAIVNAILPPSVFISSTPTACYGNTGTATAISSNGTQPYSYLWNTGDTNQAIGDLAAGVYSVTTTDFTGCLDEQSVTIVYQNQAVSTIFTNSLIAYYPFDGNVDDMSGNGLHGTLMGSPTFTTGGINNDCVNLIGSGYTGASGDHVLLPSIDFNNLNDFTINIWVNEQGLTSTDGEAYICYGTENGNVRIGHFNNNLLFTVTDTAIIVPFSSSYLNNWVQYSLVYSDGSFKGYIDGVLVGTKNRNVNISTTDAAIGRHWWWSTSTRFIGKIDEVRIFNRALSDAEISILYQGESTSDIAVSIGNDTTICENSQLILDAGTGFSSYAWNTGANTEIISLNNLNPGLHKFSVQVSACGNIISDSVFITVNPLPGSASSISGDTMVCSDQGSILYTASNISNADSYEWTLPAGASGSSSTNSIYVDFGSNATPGVITVKGNNTCGYGAETNLSIQVAASPQNISDSALLIHGDTVVCHGQTNLTYCVSDSSGPYNYYWELPNGATGYSSTGCINVNYDAPLAGGFSGNEKSFVETEISVYAYNDCGQSLVSVLPVHILFQPANIDSIAGPLTICPGQDAEYTVTPLEYAENYIWTMSNGITGTGTLNSISAQFDSSFTAGIIAVQGSNMCGDGPYTIINIVANPYPAPAGIISGTSNICAGQSDIIFSIPAIGNANYYIWSLPDGASGVSNTNYIVVDFDSSAISGTITVTGSNSCGTGPTSAFPVTIKTIPDSAGIISGIDSVCAGQNAVNYSIPLITNAVSYEWDLFNGMNGNSTSNNIIIDLDSSATSGVITVRGINSCGAGMQSELFININPRPGMADSIYGLTIVCQGQNNVQYFVSNIDYASSYLWVLPNGANGTSSTNNITVDFGSQASSGNIVIKGVNSCGFGNEFTKTVFINPLPADADYITGLTSVCQGQENVTYSISPVANSSYYLWSLPSGALGAGNTNNITVDYSDSAVSGSILVRGVNYCGYGLESVLPVTVNPIPAVSISNLDTFYCYYNPNVNIIGLPAGGYFSGPGISDSLFNPAIAGIGTWPVVYSFTDNNLCAGADTVFVIVDACTAIEDLSSDIAYVFPVPFNESFNIVASNDKDEIEFEVFDATGKLLFSGTFIGDTKIDTRTISPGLYMLKLSRKGITRFKKIIKE